MWHFTIINRSPRTKKLGLGHAAVNATPVKCKQNLKHAHQNSENSKSQNQSGEYLSNPELKKASKSEIWIPGAPRTAIYNTKLSQIRRDFASPDAKWTIHTVQQLQPNKNKYITYS